MILHLSSVAVSIVAGLFGVKIDDNQSVISLVFSIIILSVSNQIAVALPLALTHGTSFYHVTGGIASTYVALFWYYFVSNKWRRETQTRVTVKDVKDGVHIGRLFKPRRQDLKLSWEKNNHHVHILGQPGSGKSVLLRIFTPTRCEQELGS